jgi:hydroxymethylglutaryl-CoA reductase
MLNQDQNRSVIPAKKSSRLPGFFELTTSDRLLLAQSFAGLSDKDVEALCDNHALCTDLTNIFIENSIGSFALPLGIATNFIINGKDVLVPMAVEETSVLAAASHGAKLARQSGGFRTSSSAPVMTGQIQIFPRERLNFDAILSAHRQDLIDFANRGQERLVSRGGGANDVSWRYIEVVNMLVIHLYVDTREAMGANIVNTMCERVSGLIAELIPCDIGLRILSNLSDRRIARASCRIPATAFDGQGFRGDEVIRRIEQAYLFAAHDIYRAATHNKGVMNGIDPVVIATGNDWRAVEAGAHAYAAMNGGYRPMTKWIIDAEGFLVGSIELPLSVGTVGGVTKLHPTAQIALKILGHPSACELAEIICAVGLAQNLSALRALASEGIQKGHMSLHRKNLDLLGRQGASRC